MWWLDILVTEKGERRLHITSVEINHPQLRAPHLEYEPIATPAHWRFAVAGSLPPNQFFTPVTLILGILWGGQAWTAEVRLTIDTNEVGRPIVRSCRVQRVRLVEWIVAEQSLQEREGMANPARPTLTPRHEEFLTKLIGLLKAGDHGPFPVVHVDQESSDWIGTHRDVRVFPIDADQLATLGLLTVRRGTGSNYEIGLTGDGMTYLDSQNRPVEDDTQKRRTVFVVHGRNEEARAAMYALLRAARLDPLEWDHAIRLAGGGSPYVGNVVRAGMNAAHVVVVLFTGDDLARLRPEFLEPGQKAERPTPQPRPNVIFEAGMAMAIGEDRTLLVEIGRLRGLSDIEGRHAVRLNNSFQSRKRLLTRLQGMGCPADLDGDDWISAGKFPEPTGPIATTQGTQKTRPRRSILDQLTTMERLVLRMAAANPELDTSQVVTGGGMEPDEFNRRLENAMKKLNVVTRYDAAEVAIRAGILEGASG